MASSYDGAGIFGSGPHRFVEGEVGEYVLLNRVYDPFLHGSTVVGPQETRVTVTGRLVANTDSALWALRDAVTAKVTDPPMSATLVDSTGRSYGEMSLVGFVVEGPVDHGRKVSVGYTAKFVRIITV